MAFLLISATPPEIAEHPVDLTVPRGSPATLHCVAAGTPEPTITWLREDGGPVTPEGDHTVQLPDGSLFFLRTVQNPRSQDSGLYSCRAENRDGVVQSRPARLTVTCKYCSLSFDPYSFDTDPDPDFKLNPDPDPDPIRSSDFDDQKLKKIYS
jgi:hypothetical protein